MNPAQTCVQDAGFADFATSVRMYAAEPAKYAAYLQMLDAEYTKYATSWTQISCVLADVGRKKRKIRSFLDAKKRKIRNFLDASLCRVHKGLNRLGATFHAQSKNDFSFPLRFRIFTLIFGTNSFFHCVISRSKLNFSGKLTSFLDSA